MTLEVSKAACSTSARLGAVTNRQRTQSNRTFTAHGCVKLDYMYHDKHDSPNTKSPEAGFCKSIKNLTGHLLVWEVHGFEQLNESQRLQINCLLG